MRRFVIRKGERSSLEITDIDGVIAEGVQFTDGTVVLHRGVDVNTTATYGSLDDFILTHGDGFDSQIEWIDHE